jgi:zinc transport system ATP-binding protein
MTSEATRARGPVQAEAVTHVHVHEGPCAHGHAHDTEAAPADLAFDPAALVSARGLTLRRNGRALLLDVAIDIRSREIVTLIGPNGAGKTTLVRVLLGLVTPDAGVVHRRPGLRIGYAPQRFDLDRAMPMTVARFLRLGGATAAPVADALAEVGAQRVIDQQLAELSGGELQRVVLARALLRDPDLLVLDEPVRGVDYAGEAELYTLIGRIRQTRGLGVLLVSHDLHVVMAQSNRVVCLNRHVCCSGVPERVAQHPEYVRLFGAETARAFGLYHHHHDHRHDIAGEPRPADVDASDEIKPMGERSS